MATAEQQQQLNNDSSQIIATVEQRQQPQQVRACTKRTSMENTPLQYRAATGVHATYLRCREYCNCFKVRFRCVSLKIVIHNNVGINFNLQL